MQSARLVYGLASFDPTQTHGASACTTYTLLLHLKHIPMTEYNIGIKNFRAVTDWLYRGGQPDVAEIDQLVECGFRTVVSLRWNLEAIKTELAQVRERNLHFYSIPLSYWVLPTRKQIDYFLSILDDESKRPVYIHCKHGQDRVGMMTAIYRIARENWTADQAYAEMKKNGFRYVQMHQLKWAVYGFERRLQRQAKHLADTTEDKLIQLEQ